MSSYTPFDLNQINLAPINCAINLKFPAFALYTAAIVSGTLSQMTISTLIFDMDGTLLNTLHDLADSTNFALNHHGYAEHPPAAYRYFVGSGAEELIRRALPADAKDDETIATVLATYKKHYHGNWANRTELYDGIAELLNEATARGLKLAVLTNKPQPFADACMAHFLAGWHFHKVQGQIDGIPHKPNPHMAKLVMAALQINASDVLYIGDSDVDMHTATNAGFTSVGVTWGFRSRSELTEAGADHLIDHPLHILKLLN